MRTRIRRARRWLRERLRDDAGQVTPFAVVMITALLLVAGLVLDAGTALSAKVQALDIAQAAARAGAQQLNLPVYRTTGVAELDPARAERAARNWLASARVEGDAAATTAVVTVTVRRASRTQLLQLVGIRELGLTATASARAVQGINGPGT
jgi:hypothetical protein